MDFRTQLLLHTPIGLKLERCDLDALLSPALDPFDARAVRDALVSEKARAYLHRTPAWLEISRDIAALSERHGIRWVTEASEEYPRLWRGLTVRPMIFSYRGSPVWRETAMLAIVGSRTPAPETLLWMQRELPVFFKGRDLGVVSGGARGIDQWAHRLSMDCGKPTVCILPSGLLNPYPFERDELWERICQSGGAMVSTCALRAPMLTHYFHRRNRWIAGMGPMCFVAEANRRSGSLITADAAMKENRTVCTLPVFPTATQGLGNLDLIADGGFFLRDARDMATLWDTHALLGIGLRD